MLYATEVYAIGLLKTRVRVPLFMFKIYEVSTGAVVSAVNLVAWVIGSIADGTEDASCTKPAASCKYVLPIACKSPGMPFSASQSVGDRLNMTTSLFNIEDADPPLKIYVDVAPAFSKVKSVGTIVVGFITSENVSVAVLAFMSTAKYCSTGGVVSAVKAKA